MNPEIKLNRIESLKTIQYDHNNSKNLFRNFKLNSTNESHQFFKIPNQS